MNKITVKILERPYTIISEENEEITKEAAGYVDSKMRELSRDFPSLSLEKLAILTSLEIAGELLKRTKNLLSMIENI